MHLPRMIFAALTVIVAHPSAHAQLSASDVSTSQPITREVAESISRELELVIDELLADQNFRLQSPTTRPATTKEAPRQRLRRNAEQVLVFAKDSSAAGDRQPFDDASNRKFVNEARRIFRDFGLRLTDVTVYLLRQDGDRPLSGTRLELLAQLATGHLDQLQKAVGAPRR